MGRVTKSLIHVMLVFVAFLAAYELRLSHSLNWWLSSPSAPLIVLMAGIYALVAACVELVFRTERSSWRFSSAQDALVLARSATVTAVIFLSITFLAQRADNLPRSTIVMAWLLSLAALVGIRLAWRVVHERSLIRGLLTFGQLRQPVGVPLILVGNAREAESYLRRSADEDEYAPVGLFTNGLPKGHMIRGVPVVGDTADIDKVDSLADPKAPAGAAILFFGDNVAGEGLTAEQVGRLRNLGFRLLRQPSLTEMQTDGADIRALREMKLEDFLPRAPLTLDSDPIRELVAGRRVLVTGAGGSIGSEIARQLVHFGCSHITLVDHSEFLLFEIDRQLGSGVQDSSRSAMLCNVRDEERVREVFASERPELVFHAAALKHVTLVENNPREGVLTNVLGTRNVARACDDFGVRQMVLISTDKAANPSSIMGATKRIAESVLSEVHGKSKTRFCAVRFGNVLGSAGSVVPIFQNQIESGGPVTVTDPDVERFFMTIPEAVQLVLQATALSASSPRNAPRKFVLEMGRPVKIMDLARQMIELSGCTPDVDIKIEITGLRPGEKITEILIDDNENVASCVPGINEIQLSGGADGDPNLTQAVIESAMGGSDRLEESIFETISRLRGELRPLAVNS